MERSHLPFGSNVTEPSETRRGRIARLIAPVSKTGIPQGIVGSNPTLSAKLFCYTSFMVNKSSGKHLLIESAELPNRPKNSLWYLGVGILLLGFLIVTFYSRDYLLMAVVVAAGVAVFRLANQHSETKKVAFSDAGVDWGGKSLPYHHFKAFWLGFHDGQYNLYLDQTNWRPNLSLMIAEKDIEPLAEILGAHLPFHAHKNVPLPDRFSRLLGL